MVAGWLRLGGPAGSKCGWRPRSQPGRGPVTGGWRGGAGVVTPQAVPGQLDREPAAQLAIPAPWRRCGLGGRRVPPGSLRPPGPVRPPGAAGAARRPAGHDVAVRTLLAQRQQAHDHVVTPGPRARPSPPCPIPAAPPASAVHARAPAPPPRPPQRDAAAAQRSLSRPTALAKSRLRPMPHRPAFPTASPPLPAWISHRSATPTIRDR
jgi:hypothetical protein